MRKELIQQEYPEIYHNPHDYGLLRTADDSSSFMIIFKRNRMRYSQNLGQGLLQFKELSGFGKKYGCT